MRSHDMEPALQDAVTAIVSAAKCLETNARSATRHVDDATSALEAISVMQRALTSTAGAQVDTHVPLLTLRAARADILAYELGRQRSMLPMLTEGLARLRTAVTINDLVESIPIQAVGLGYERSMFSWVEQERWVPRSMCTTSGPQEAQAALLAGAAPYVHVRELMEVAVVRDRRAILVLDAESNPRVHPKIIPVTQSQTYVAAPIIARDHVAGFVHLDRNASTGTTDEFDRDLLGFFCESIGVMLDRLLTVDTSPGVDEEAPPVASWAAALTTREREVLALMAGGLTNAQIGARLFVSEETIKTHVKKLMRKLGVSNRSQAGAMYHRSRASVVAGANDGLHKRRA